MSSSLFLCHLHSPLCHQPPLLCHLRSPLCVHCVSKRCQTLPLLRSSCHTRHLFRGSLYSVEGWAWPLCMHDHTAVLFDPRRATRGYRWRQGSAMGSQFVNQSVMLEATVPTPAVHDRLPHAAVPLPVSAVDLARPLKRISVGEPAAVPRPRKHAAVAATPEEKAARPLMAREPSVQVARSKAGAGCNRGVKRQRQRDDAVVPRPWHCNDMEMDQQWHRRWNNDQQMELARAYHWIANNVPPRFLKPSEAGPAQPGNSLSPAAFECLYANLAKVEVLEQMGTRRQVRAQEPPPPACTRSQPPRGSVS
jgi:hypothetical protein